MSLELSGIAYDVSKAPHRAACLRCLLERTCLSIEYRMRLMVTGLVLMRAGQ